MVLLMAEIPPPFVAVLLVNWFTPLNSTVLLYEAIPPSLLSENVLFPSNTILQLFCNVHSSTSVSYEPCSCYKSIAVVHLERDTSTFLKGDICGVKLLN